MHPHGFAPDTPIHTGNIKLPISTLYKKVRKHWHIHTYDCTRQTYASERVTRSAKGSANALIQITFDTALSHDLICTPSQLLFSTDKNKWVSAYLLTSGACLFSRAGPIAIKNIHVISGSPSAIYTIETENTHTFFAGHYGILAHNMLIPEITFSLAASFGTGATVGATTASFLGPIVCSCSNAIGRPYWHCCKHRFIL